MLLRRCIKKVLQKLLRIFQLNDIINGDVENEQKNEKKENDLFEIKTINDEKNDDDLFKINVIVDEKNDND